MKIFAGFCQHDIMMRPDKKLESNVLFKLRNILADRLLRHEHELACFRKTESFRECQKASDGSFVNQYHTPCSLFQNNYICHCPEYQPIRSPVRSFPPAIKPIRLTIRLKASPIKSGSNVKTFQMPNIRTIIGPPTMETRV